MSRRRHPTGTGAPGSNGRSIPRVFPSLERRPRQGFVEGGGSYREAERAESPIDFNLGERHDNGHDDGHDDDADFGWDGNVDSGDAAAEDEVAEENAGRTKKICS